MKPTCRWMILIAAVAGLMGVTACEPLSDDWWNDNVTVTTFWQNACPETGRKPAGLNDCTAYYYPRSGDIPYKTRSLPHETTEITLGKGNYDALVVQQSVFVTDRSQYRTVSLQLPTEFDGMGNRVITDNPKEMLYYATMEEVDVAEDGKNYHDFIMKRCLKEITFEITVKDSAELIEDCIVDISGVATRMRLHDGMIADEQAILRFPVKKYGRKKDYEDCVLTQYRGTEFLLGVKGDNILRLTLTDSKGEKRTVSADLTSYLHYWTTESVTCTLFVDIQEEKVSDGTWSGGADDINQNL